MVLYPTASKSDRASLVPTATANILQHPLGVTAHPTSHQPGLHVSSLQPTLGPWPRQSPFPGTSLPSPVIPQPGEPYTFSSSYFKGHFVRDTFLDPDRARPLPHFPRTQTRSVLALVLLCNDTFDLCVCLTSSPLSTLEGSHGSRR